MKPFLLSNSESTTSLPRSLPRPSGTEGQTGLAMQGEDRIIHLPKDGEFLKARLKPDPKKASWEVVQLKGWAMTERRVYFLDGKKWRAAEPGEMVWGQILGEEIKLFGDI